MSITWARVSSDDPTFENFSDTLSATPSLRDFM